MALLSALSFGAAIFANATSTQLPGPMTANAPEKMMPHEKAQKMREWASRATKDRDERSRPLH
jgi:hypothetical protein